MPAVDRRFFQPSRETPPDPSRFLQTLPDIRREGEARPGPEAVTLLSASGAGDSESNNGAPPQSNVTLEDGSYATDADPPYGPGDVVAVAQTNNATKGNTPAKNQGAAKKTSQAKPKPPPPIDPEHEANKNAVFDDIVKKNQGLFTEAIKGRDGHVYTPRELNAALALIASGATPAARGTTAEKREVQLTDAQMKMAILLARLKRLASGQVPQDHYGKVEGETPEDLEDLAYATNNKGDNQFRELDETKFDDILSGKTPEDREAFAFAKLAVEQAVRYGAMTDQFDDWKTATRPGRFARGESNAGSQTNFGKAPNPEVDAGGRKFIKDYETFEPNVYYLDKQKKRQPTVGYGHRIFPGENISGPLTQQQAEELFEKDIETRVMPYLRRVEVPLNQNQVNAVASFIFNTGGPRFLKSTLFKKLNQGDYAAVGVELQKYYKSTAMGQGLKGLPGLTPRRLDEAQLFNRPL